MATLLERIWFSCRHQFSWPRRSEDGGYYQVCLECGVRYRYDWSSMRRVARLDLESEAEPENFERKPVGKCDAERTSAPAAGHVAVRRKGWHPRERRLRVVVPVLYREKGGVDWLNGQSENISRSGLLFHAEKPLPLGTAVELIFEMPVEICGSAASNVICQATVARVLPQHEGQQTRLAASIADCEYLPQGKVAGL